MNRTLLAMFLWVLASCGAAENPPDNLPAGDPDKFTPPALKEGMTRILLPPVMDIQPGQESMWCQWVSEGFDREMDILEVTGAQGVGGHHAILYATTSRAPIGTTRECYDEDLVSVRYLGAIGGEGLSSADGKLPPGIAYRLPAGYALMANVHYVNYKTKPINGEGVLDLRIVEKDESRQIATLFTNLDIEVSIEASSRKSMDVECVLQEDMDFFWFGNHMHNIGVSAYTEVIRHDTGATELVRRDETWTSEAKFNPPLTAWPLDNPFKVRRGDKLHTHCEWNNTSDKPVEFPGEMCVGFGFHVGGGTQVNCIKGEWTH